MVFSKIKSFFARKKEESKQTEAKSSSEDREKIKGAFGKVKSDIEKLRKEAEEVSARLAAHNNMMKEHEKELKKQAEELLQQSLKLSEHTEKISTLEEMFHQRNSHPIASNEAPKRSMNREQQLVASKLAHGQSTYEIVWDSFTPQEKRLIGAFLENKDMPLSYEDVGKHLGKAPSTIKNQMKNIDLKAKIFQENRDNEQRKRFSLKSGLRINKSLD